MTANQIKYAEYKENVRHNSAQEALTKRATDVQEKVGMGQVGVGYAQVGLGYSQLGEATRHNRVQESINWMQTQNQKDYWTSTSNSQRIQATQRALEQKEAKRHNEVMEAETQRHNEAQEGIGMADAIISGISGLARSFMPLMIGG